MELCNAGNKHKSYMSVTAFQVARLKVAPAVAHHLWVVNILRANILKLRCLSVSENNEIVALG